MPRGSRALLEQFAQALATGQTPVQAAETAGYPPGSSFASNARKRAVRDDVKARVAQLQQPHLQKVNEAVALNAEWITQRCVAIANERLASDSIKTADQLRAMELLARMNGWLAPEKTEMTGELKIARIERVIIDVEDRDGGDLPPAAESGEI